MAVRQQGTQTSNRLRVSVHVRWSSSSAELISCTYESVRARILPMSPPPPPPPSASRAGESRPARSTKLELREAEREPGREPGRESSPSLARSVADISPASEDIAPASEREPRRERGLGAASAPASGFGGSPPASTAPATDPACESHDAPRLLPAAAALGSPSACGKAAWMSGVAQRLG
jgi:hypothetical protein